jgi:hypothetical protein
LFRAFKGKAYINADALFVKDHQAKETAKTVEHKSIIKGELNEIHLKKMAQFKDWLSSRRYSPNTIKNLHRCLAHVFKIFS